MIYISTSTNISISECIFSDLMLREARIFYALSYSQIIFINNSFTNIYHICYDTPSSNCLYFLFDMYTYNNVILTNVSLNNITINADNNLFRIYSTNNVNFTNVTMENMHSINAASTYMINFFSGNIINFLNVMVNDYSVGYSAGFFNFDNRNRVIFLNSIFIANNPDNIASGQIININTLNVIYVNYTTFGNMCGTYRNNFYTLSYNNITVYRSYWYNMTGSKGGAASLSNNNNFFIAIESIMDGLYTINFGSLLYVVSTTNNVLLSGCIFLNLYAVQGGALLFIELNHIVEIDGVQIYNLYSNMYAGFIQTLSYNVFFVNNCTISMTQSQSNGGLIDMLQYNSIIVNNSTFNSCSSSRGQAGILYTFLNNNITFMNVSLIGDYSEQEGGCFFLDNNNWFNITSSTMQNLHAGSDGGFLLLKQNNSIIINNCTFINTISNIDGGILKAQKRNNITLEFVIIYNSISLQNGGSFYLDSYNNFLLINSVVNVSSCVNGGLIVASLGNYINLSQCNFSNLEAQSQGGGIWLNILNYIIVEECYFNASQSLVGNGGLIYMNYNNKLSFNENYVMNISTMNYGGFIYAYQNNSIEINNCFFNDISSEMEGSFVYLYINNTIILCQNIIINENYYGMLYFNELNNFWITNTSFIITNSEFNSYFLLSYRNNSGFLAESIINLNYSLIENINLFYLNEFSYLFINKTGISFDACDKLFSINQNSFLHIISFNLTEFHSSTSSFIDCLQNSKFIADSMNLRYNEITLIISSNNSTIILIAFIFQISNQTSMLINTFTSNVKIVGGLIERMKYRINSQILLSVNSIINFKKIYIYGFFYKDGGIATLYNSALKISLSYILLNQALNNGGAFSLYFSNDFYQQKANYYNISIFKTIIFNNNARFLGGLISIINNQPNIIRINVLLRQNNARFNKAFQGGVVYAENINQINLSFSKFRHNKANKYYIHNNMRSKGGVLYAINNNNSLHNECINISKCTFIKNIAEIGAVCYNEGFNINFFINSNNDYFKNKAFFYGDTIATETEKIRFLTLDKSLLDFNPFKDNYTYARISGIKSGNIYDSCLLLMNGYDKFNSITYGTDENLLQMIHIQQLDNLIYSNTFYFSQYNGLICLNGTFSRNELPLELSFEYKLHIYIEFLTLKLSFKHCDVGERLNVLYQCQPCPSGTYSFTEDFTKESEMCHLCDYQNFYCYGGGNYTPKPGYWRFASDSYVFYQCLNELACLGDPRNFSDPMTQYLDIYSSTNCEVGYTGPLCATCLNGYGIVDGYSCVSCQNRMYYLQIFGNLILRIIFTLYLIHVSVHMCLSLMNNKPNKSKIIATNLLKIFTNHMQIIGIILKLPISIPFTIRQTSTAFLCVTPNVGEAFSIECILQSFDYVLSLQYFKVIMSGIYPLVIVPIYIVFFWNFKKIMVKIFQFKLPTKFTIQSSSPVKQLTNRDLFITVFNLIFFICFADISYLLLSMFGCGTIGDGIYKKNLLFADLNIDCDGNLHKTWIMKLSIPLMSFYLFIYPIYIIRECFLILYKKNNKNDVDNSKFYFRFGYIFYAYNRKFFFWDFIILTRKILLIFVNNFFLSQVKADVALYPAIIILMLLILAFILQIYCKPFQSDFYFINNLEEFSLIISSMTVLCFLIIISSSSSIDDNIDMLLIVNCVVINLCFFIVWFKFYYKLYLKEKISKTLSSVMPILKGNKINKVIISSHWTKKAKLQK